MPQMPQPFNLPPGAQMSPVPGYPGMMAVTMPQGAGPNALVPASGNALSQQPVEDEQPDMGFDFGEGTPDEDQVDDPEQQAEPEPEPEPEPEAPSIMQVATEAGLSMPTQKRARKALRVLVRKLSGTKQEDWFGHIANAIQNEIGIYHYVKAVTVRAALLEGGANDELAVRVMDAMRESGMIPADVEYE